MALRHNGRSPVQAFLRLADIDNRILSLFKNLEESRGDMDIFVVILLPAFDQKHFVCGHLLQPRGQHAPCRAAARDDVIVSVDADPPSGANPSAGSAENGLYRGEFLQAFLAKFHPEAGLFHPAEWCVGLDRAMLVDPDRPALEAARQNTSVNDDE